MPCTFMVFCGQDDVLGTGSCKELRPLFGVKELSGEHWRKVLVPEAWGVVLLHEVHIGLQLLLLPVPPVSRGTPLGPGVYGKRRRGFLCKTARTKSTHQNHSLPKLGTEKTPQWMKMPNLAWSYHSGSGLESIESQFGSYLAPAEPSNSADSRTAGQPIVTTNSAVA